MSQEPTANPLEEYKVLEDYQMRLVNGLLVIEEGLSMSGVSIDMVKNLREVYMTLSTLTQALDGKEILKLDPEVEVEHHKARCLLAYLRKTREPLISGMSNQSKTKGGH